MQLQFKAFVNDCHQHISGDNCQYLSLHDILGRAEKSSDPQMSFDLLEEQLDLLTAFTYAV